jgi:hypothetical protein
MISTRQTITTAAVLLAAASSAAAFAPVAGAARAPQTGATGGLTNTTTTAVANTKGESDGSGSLNDKECQNLADRFDSFEALGDTYVGEGNMDQAHVAYGQADAAIRYGDANGCVFY